MPALVDLAPGALPDGPEFTHLDQTIVEHLTLGGLARVQEGPANEMILPSHPAVIETEAGITQSPDSTDWYYDFQANGQGGDGNSNGSGSGTGGRGDPPLPRRDEQIPDRGNGDGGKGGKGK